MDFLGQKADFSSKKRTNLGAFFQKNPLSDQGLIKHTYLAALLVVLHGPGLVVLHVLHGSGLVVLYVLNGPGLVVIHLLLGRGLVVLHVLHGPGLVVVVVDLSPPGHCQGGIVDGAHAASTSPRRDRHHRSTAPMPRRHGQGGSVTC